MKIVSCFEMLWKGDAIFTKTGSQCAPTVYSFALRPTVDAVMTRIRISRTITDITIKHRLEEERSQTQGMHGVDDGCDEGRYVCSYQSYFDWVPILGIRRRDILD